MMNASAEAAQPLKKAGLFLRAEAGSIEKRVN
jgi:hypothetical protein